MLDPNRRRLKLLGRLRFEDARKCPPEHLEAVALQDYSARIEHIVYIDVVAFDWNCRISTALFQYLFKRIGLTPGVHPAHLENITGPGALETESEGGIFGNGSAAICEQHGVTVVREGELLDVMPGHEFARVGILT